MKQSAQLMSNRLILQLRGGRGEFDGPFKEITCITIPAFDTRDFRVQEQRLAAKISLRSAPHGPGE